MPNHITNRLSMQGTENQIKEVRDFIKGESENKEEQIHIDFNKIISMPEELEISCNTLGEISQGLLFGTGKSFFLGIDQLQKRFKELDEELRKESIELGLKYQDNLEKYGSSTWYDWSISNWGTKWNAYSQQEQSDSTIFFETAWSGVIDLISKLSEKFPDVIFEYEYADEDTGANCGQGLIANGDISQFIILDNQSNEAYELAFKLNGGEEYYELIDGRYQYKEDCE